MHKPIVLMGFKHVGKTVIGRQLAKALKKDFIDVDHYLENLYAQQYGQALTCRQIVHSRGPVFFRALEHHALCGTLALQPDIIALGGGTPLAEANQSLLQATILVHINASRQLVFDRIMQSEGALGFFHGAEDPWLAFNRLWDERADVYRQLARFSVRNDTSVAAATKQILNFLQWRSAG